MNILAHDRAVNRNNNVTYRSAHKQNQPPTEINDEIAYHRQEKQPDSNEYVPGNYILLIEKKKVKFLLDPSSKPIGSTSREKDYRLLPTTQNKGPIATLLKASTIDWRKSLISNINERESPSTVTDEICGNTQVLQSIKQKEILSENEGDLIEHDLLNLVEEEEQRDSPPALPIKNRAITTIPMPTIKDSNNNLDVNIEPTIKLVHPGNSRQKKTTILYFESMKLFLFR